MTSGLIQYGVPTSDFRLGSSADTCAQNPKSDNLTCRKKDDRFIFALFFLFFFREINLLFHQHPRG